MNLEDATMLALQGKLVEARSHKEDNERVAPRVPAQRSEATVTVADDDEDERAYYGRNMSKRDRVRSREQAHKNMVRRDFDERVTYGGTVDQMSFEKSPNKDIELYKRRKELNSKLETKNLEEKSSSLPDIKYKPRTDGGKNYRKIDLYVDGEYWCSTNAYKTIRDAVASIPAEYPELKDKTVKGYFAENKNLEEKANPENKDINDKIRKTINGSDKYKDELTQKGLEIGKNYNGKTRISGTNGNSIDKATIKDNSKDVDYYNYMTKQKVQPEETATGEFASNIFRDSDNFEKTIGSKDTTYSQTDRNGVSKAIPKKYKTGQKNFGKYDWNKPYNISNKNVQGVASYEPLNNKELNDFKNNKRRLGDRQADLDKAKAEYDIAKAEYDDVNNQLQNVRDRIAKSKEASSKKENRRVCFEAKKPLTESSDVTSDFLEDLRNLLNKHCRANIFEMELSEDGNTVTIDQYLSINVNGDSCLGAMKDIITKLN